MYIVLHASCIVQEGGSIFQRLAPLTGEMPSASVAIKVSPNKNMELGVAARAGGVGAACPPLQ